MSKPATVCVVGSANIDLTFRTHRLPQAGETVKARDFHFGCGGKGANQAVMAALFGARALLIARVGADPFGDQLVENLRSCGVNTDRVEHDAERPTGMASILVDDSARNCIAVAPGANAALTPEVVRSAADAIRQAGALLCQLETPIEASVEAFRIAREAGVRTILNPAPAQSLPADLLELTDLCVPNESEAALLSGLSIDGPEAASEAARAIRKLGPRSVIVTLGSRGCLLEDGNDVQHFPAPKVAAVDPTGAGDAFLGTAAAILAAGGGLREAIPLACAAASLSVTRPGAQGSYPSRREVEAFLSQQSRRPAETGKGKNP
jgi:ribokinase